MTLLVSCLTLFEILFYCIALFTFFKHFELSTPDSLTYAIVTLFASYSAIIQLCFLLNILQYFYLIDILILFSSCCLFYKFHQIFPYALVESFHFLKNYKIILIPFLCIYCYLFLQVLLLPPSSWDAFVYDLPRVILMQKEGSLFLQNYSCFNQVSFLVGSDILHFLFLRFYSDWFSGLFSFFCYTVILISTLSLVQKVFHKENLSIITTLIIGSMVEIVLQSTSAKNDIHLTAMAAVSFLSGYNLTVRRGFFDAYILVTSLVLGTCIKAYFIGFSLSFIFLFAILYYKEIYLFFLNFNVQSIKSYFILGLTPLLLVIFLAIFLHHNYNTYGHPFGEAQHINSHINRDGWQGALYNALRYSIQMTGLPREFGGKSLTKFHDDFLAQKKSWGSADSRVDIELSVSAFWPPDEYRSWYGPLSVFVAVPAILYGALAGPKFIRLASWSLTLFFLVVCLEIGWMPPNNRFFSLFFGASGICIASFLKKVDIAKMFTLLLVISLSLMAYAALFNRDKPIVDLLQVARYIDRVVPLPNELRTKTRKIYPFQGYQVFNWVYYIFDRDGYFRKHYKDERVKIFTNYLKPNSRLMIIADNGAWILPFIFKRPDLSIVVTDLTKCYLNGKVINQKNADDIYFLKKTFDYFIVINIPPPDFLASERLVFQRDAVLVNQEIDVDSFYLYDYSSKIGESPGMGDGAEYFAGKILTAGTNYHSETNLRKCQELQLDAYFPFIYFWRRDHTKRPNAFNMLPYRETQQQQF